ncbi:MAG: hypothetical protein OEZ15_10910, partial [Gammaproteobacteria bacterium]|nr:hypothetical protein [Gammaproteobacteria bacterium]
MRTFLSLTILCSTILSATSNAAELSGNISVQGRLFTNDPLDTAQHNQYSSIALEPELYQPWNDSNQRLTLHAFYRHDQYDEERSHGDIRELSWLGVFD